VQQHPFGTGRLLHDRPEVSAASSRAEAVVRSGLMTAGDGTDSVIRSLGLGVKGSDGST
jgi:hypothetical protein